MTQNDHGGVIMENIKLNGLEISIKLDNISAVELRKTINYIFSDLIQTNHNADLEDNKELDNKQIELNNKEITDKQIKYIQPLAKEKDIGKVELQNYSMSIFGKDSSRSLTRHEASQLIAALNDLEYNVLDHLKV